MNLPNGHILQNGKYQITQVIGQGGFGITYQGIWFTEVKGSLGTIRTEVPICIKEYFFKDYCYREEGTWAVKVHSETGRMLFDKFKEKLIKEAKILSEVHHPHIVNVLEVFEENHTAYAVTWVYSPREQPAGLLLEFQNYSRSESDLPPLQGKWDYKESRAWLNGVTLSPPVWENVHRQRSNEVPLANENCVSRPPLQVTLHEGWNKLLLKLPVGRFQTPEVRLVKWMFTAMFVTPDGRDELDGLVYSADKPVR